MRWLAVTALIFGCDNTRCFDEHCGGTHYQFCQQAGGGCYYKTSNDQVFVCNTCADCVDAKQSVDGWCEFAPPDNQTFQSCTNAICPQGAGSYKFCSASKAASCSYLTGDGSQFACASCSDCATAVQAVTDWCAGTQPSNPPSSNPDLSQPQDCNSCLDTAQQSGGACFGDIDQCRNDAACTSYITCLNSCSDATCQSNCRSNAPSATVSQVDAIEACLCGACSTCGC